MVMILGELMHQSIWSYSDSTGVHFKKDVLYNSDIRKKFTQQIFNRLENNTEIGAVLRLFIQTHHISDLNYKDLINQLKFLNFKFIHLTRNIFNSTISLSMAQHTNLWHRRIKGEKEVIIGNIEYATSPTVVHLPLTLFGSTYMDLKYHHYYTSQLLQDLEYATISYENMIQDITSNDIPIEIDSTVKKTHNIEYKDIISNYKELQHFYGQLING